MSIAQEITTDSVEASHNINNNNKTRGRLNKYTLAVAALASTTSILLGYDIGVMSGAKMLIQDDLNFTDKQIAFLVGSLNVISLLGSLIAGKLSDRIGRRNTIIFAAGTFLLGALLMGIGSSYGLLMAGRLIAGVGVGLALMISPVYTAEISPASTRGLLGSLPEIFVNVGILFGYLANYTLAYIKNNHINWRIMLGVAAIPSLGIILGAYAMPESPRWLLMKGRKDEARSVLVKTSYGGEEEADIRLAEIASTATSTISKDWHGQGVWKELLFQPTRAVRRVLVAAIGINFFMQASGNDAIVYYCPEVFKEAGIRTQSKLMIVNVVMGCAKTTFVLISALFLDKFGRRPLLLLGSCGMAVSLTALGLGSRYLYNSVEKPTWAIAICIVAVCADVSFFSIGLGPVTWIYSSEIFPSHLRAQGSGIAISVNRLVSGVVTTCFPMVARKVTYAVVFFAFAVITLVGCIFFYVFLPETKGKNLEDIEELFDSQRGSRAESREMTQR